MTPSKIVNPPSIFDHFGQMEDPRVVGRTDHKLIDLVVIAILATICGAEGWTDMEEFAVAREEWLRTFLELPSGIPTDDTFRRFFGKLKPSCFEQAFTSWTKALAGALDGKVVAIDGKSVRGSTDRSTGKPMLHLVHAWLADNQLLLGQFATDVKSNEITAIPELLALLDIQGAVITIDAAGCQKNIASQIHKQKADYVLSLRDNHPTFHEEVLTYFEHEKTTPSVHSHETFDGGEHGRSETRRVYSTSDVGWFSEKGLWPGLKSFVLVDSKRELSDGKVAHDQRTYISSLDGNSPATLGQFVRRHWSVENQLHWMLDVAFREDECQVRKDHGPRNLSLLRKLALMLVRKEATHKRGVAVRRKRAAWDNSYLLKVIAAGTDGV